MSGPWARVRVTDGTAQDQRMPYALEDGYFLPQERKLHDHLAYLARLSELIRFHGPASEGRQTWAPLFNNEPAIAMARMLALQVAERRFEFEAALSRSPDEALALIHRRASELRDICKTLHKGTLEVSRIVNRIEAVGEEVPTGELLALLREYADLRPGALVLRLAERFAVTLAGDPVTRAHASLRILSGLHEQLLNVHVALRPHIRRAFDARLESSDVDPAIGLIVSQLKLLGEAEDRINGFLDRHTQFYYRGILGQAPREATPETILLRFQPSGPPTIIEAGTIVKGRIPGRTKLQSYKLLEPVRAVNCRIGESRSLIHDRDPKISRQTDLGYVTGVRAALREVSGASSSQRLFDPRVESDVALGIDVSGDTLRLAEGRREISLSIKMQKRHGFELPEVLPPGLDRRNDEEARDGRLRAFAAMASSAGPAFAAGADADHLDRIAGTADDLVTGRKQGGHVWSDQEIIHRAALREAKSARQVQAVYGQVVAETLVEGRAWPNGEFQRELLKKIKMFLVEEQEAGATGVDDEHNALTRACAWFKRPPEEIYQEVFLNGAFKVMLSTAKGFIEVPTARAVPNRPGNGPGFTLHMVLDTSMPPVEPGPGADRPVMQVRMTGGSLFCPFSLFEDYSLDEIRIDVAVSGVRQLVGFSDDGPLNLAQPFYPFGARPKDGAEFLAGSREMAVKPVTKVTADLVWSELPRGAGGFEEHYQDYGRGFEVPYPFLVPSYLTGDGWKSLAEGPVPMTAKRRGIVTLIPERRLGGPVPGQPVAAQSGTSKQDFKQRQAIRAGLFRLHLDCPGAAFGHSVYPAALSYAMRPSYLPWRRQRMPETPYTPEISQISLNYEATETIILDAPLAAQPGQKVSQISPFGTQEIYPSRQRPGAGIFPERIANGNLFMRVEGAQARGSVSLLFDMEDSSHQRISFDPEPVTWHYLSENGWRILPLWALEADSTDGYMRSGVVRLNIPDDVATSSSEMPGEGVWLAICADDNLSNFPRLESVSVNGARAARVDVSADGYSGEMPQTWLLDPPRPGIAGITRLGEITGGTPPEKKRAFRIRVSERLRHRKRAVMPWDLERLVLEAFPEVWKAKCFPAMDQKKLRSILEEGGSDKVEPVPGAVTMIVVPFAPPDAQDRPAQPRMFDVLTLRKIQAELQAVASPFARIQVSNPSFEWLQMRAMIGFAKSQDDGSLTQRLKLDVSRYFAVWTAQAPLNGFGWRVNLRDLGAYVSGLNYVDFVTELSVLQRVNDDHETYRLVDTARLAPGNGQGSGKLRYHHPWGLALPMSEHWIFPARDGTRKSPVPAGVGGLAVGQTLVVGAGNKKTKEFEHGPA